MKDLSKETKKDFINFLKTNRAFTAFKKERKRQYLSEYYRTYENDYAESYKRKVSTVKNGSFRTLCLIYAFDWGTSVKGFKYWKDLSVKWWDYCERNY